MRPADLGRFHEQVLVHHRANDPGLLAHFCRRARKFRGCKLHTKAVGRLLRANGADRQA